MMKRVLALAMALALLLTGCSGGGGSSTEESGTTLRVVPYTQTESFDPYQGDVDNILTAQLYDFLFQRDADGTVQPDLAAEWTDSEDEMSTTVKLRDDVTFSDGTPFNADAVVYSFGLAQESYYQTGVLYFESCEKVDDTTVVFHKLASYTDTAALLTDYMPIVSPTAYEADPEAFAAAPVGTGAYTLDRFDAQTGYAYLTAREDYFQGTPGIANIEIQAPLDSSVALVALENGETDLVELPLTNSDNKIAEEEGLAVEVSTGWSMKTLVLFGEPFKSDKNLGLAVTYAVNKENAALSNEELEVVPATNLFAKALMGDLEGKVDIYGYDPEKAAEYLAKSDYNGEPLYIDITEEAASIATSVQADLKAIGINAEINQMDATTYGEQFEKAGIHMTILDFGVASFGLEDSIQPMCTGGFYESEGMVSPSPEMDEWMEKVLAAPNAEERNAALVELMKALQDSAIQVPLYESVLSFAHNADLEGCEAIWGATTMMHLWKCSFK